MEEHVEKPKLVSEIRIKSSGFNSGTIDTRLIGEMVNVLRKNNIESEEKPTKLSLSTSKKDGCYYRQAHYGIIEFEYSIRHPKMTYEVAEKLLDLLKRNLGIEYSSIILKK